jgi:hypothetical protein
MATSSESDRKAALESANIIIQLLQDNKEDMKHLHECVHDVSAKLNLISVYFQGMEPQEHILDHAKIQDLFSEKQEIARAKSTALYSVAASLFVALVMAIGSYSVHSAQNDLKVQMQEVVRAQQSQYPNRK